MINEIYEPTKLSTLKLTECTVRKGGEMKKLKYWPNKKKTAFEMREQLFEFEKVSHFHEFEKNLFDEGPHLTSSTALPWGDAVRELVSEAKKRFEWGQIWHSGKGARQMERQVISMMGEMFHNSDALGFICYGGSESDICALAAAKGKAFVKRFPDIDHSDPYALIGHIAEFEKDSHSVVMPLHSHYSLYKGCALLGMEPIPVFPKEGTIHEIDPKDIEAAIREDTVGLVGTAGTWPFGSIDPIEEMGSIALDKDLFFHVDACFGGFILPFLERSGYHKNVPTWDFRVPGVSSISADLHKNGMVPPPASSLYFKDRQTIDYARMISPPFGTLSGTRSTGPMAAAWTMLQALGVEGYTEIAEHCMHLREELIEAVTSIPKLKVVEGGMINLTVIYSEEINLKPVSNALIEEGWMHVVDQTPAPLSLCICTMPQNDGQIQTFAEALAKAVDTHGKTIDPNEQSDGYDIYGNLDLEP